MTTYILVPGNRKNSCKRQQFVYGLFDHCWSQGADFVFAVGRLLMLLVVLCCLRSFMVQELVLCMRGSQRRSHQFIQCFLGEDNRDISDQGKMLFVCVCLSVCLSVCLPACLSVCLSVCLFCLCVCLSVCLFCLWVCLSVCLSVCSSVCLSVCLSV